MSTFIEGAEANMHALSQNSYPGRGIILGTNGAGDKFVQVYWVCGRSDNSRNRILTLGGIDGRTVSTAPYLPSKTLDLSLIIYNAMRSIRGFHFVTNGSQTDDLLEEAGYYTSEGENHINPRVPFTGVLLKHTFEPDAPNFTPRISGMIYDRYRGRCHTAMLSKIYRDGPMAHLSRPPAHAFYSYSEMMLPGEGRCMHTYTGDGDPLPTFDRDPYPVLLPGGIDDIARTYWELLNPDNRVALVVKTIAIPGSGSNDIDHRIINQLS